MRSRIYLFLICLLCVLSLGETTILSAKTKEQPKPALVIRSIAKGEKHKIKVQNLKKNYSLKVFQWNSSNEEVASISPKGIVIGKAPGKTKITLAIKKANIELTSTLKVVPYIKTKKIKITNIPKEEICVGTKLELDTTVSPQNAKYKKILWTSSNPKIASINSKGKIKALKKGTTTITALVKNTKKKVSFRLKVKNYIKLKKITITGAQEVFAGSQIQLNTSLSPSNTDYNNILWKSNKPNIATVNENGIVQGISPGKVTITAYEKECNKKCKYKIKVKKVPATSITFTKNNITTMNVGASQKLQVQIAPLNTTDKSVIWKSSDPSIATVDKNGIVKALRPSEYIEITATSSDNRKLSCKWTMKINKTNGYITKSMLDNLNLDIINNVMIVAHPDDETFWGGAHLIEDEYFVICFTHGWNPKRRADFEKVMSITNDKYIMLDYPDVKKYNKNGTYLTDTLTTCQTSMKKDIETILTYKAWEKVVTHNPNGEYGKFLHKELCKLVTSTYNQLSEKNFELWYFGHYYNKGKMQGETISDKLQEIKQKLLNSYLATASGAIKAFGHMMPYENWILYSDWNKK